jgi:hypothetical protein
MRKKWHYRGYANIERGGRFYCIDSLEDGHAEAVCVYHCADEGAQDNCWWVEEHTINIPNTREKVERALKYSGMLPIDTDTPLMCVIALHEYGDYDKDSSVAVQIGPDDLSSNRPYPIEPDIKLRAGTNLEKWVRRRYNLGSNKLTQTRYLY